MPAHNWKSEQITAAQIQKLQTLRRRAGWDDDLYHSVILAPYGVTSTTLLTKGDASELIGRFIAKQTRAATFDSTRPDGITTRQIMMLRDLLAQCGLIGPKAVKWAWRHSERRIFALDQLTKNEGRAAIAAATLMFRVKFKRDFEPSHATYTEE